MKFLKICPQSNEGKENRKEGKVAEKGNYAFLLFLPRRFTLEE
jgi:hypothetical protein